ncbi:MAG: RNA polymerase sigma factor [Anaerolineales bacterium]
MDQAALIRDAQRGDLDAFNRLVLEYQQQVYNLAYRIMGEPEAAADATQEAFLAAYRKLRAYRGGSFQGWLLRIVTNACYDELRRRKRRPAQSLDELTEAGQSPSDETGNALHTPPVSPHAAAERAELSAAIQRCLDDLPDDQRIAVAMCDVQGYDYGEIAHARQVALGTVKSRIARARGRLRDCLREHYAELLPAGFRLEEESMV